MRIRRRDFLKSILVGGASLWNWKDAFGWQAPAVQAAPPDPHIKRVLVMFKCHLDVGFVNTQASVIQQYFTEFFPRAIDIATQMRESGKERYIWTTSSWLLYEYLEQASTEDRKRMEVAIGKGDIAWHALPFNWQTELIDSSMIEGSLALSDSLDRRFVRKTTGAKLTDVPGHTRGLIGPLAEHGVKFLDVGVNSASRPAEVPPVFIWKDSNGAELLTMYHHGYGDIVAVPNSDLAVAIIVRGDNTGPHPPEEIHDIYADLHLRFPNATVRAASLTDIANAVEPLRGSLPLVMQEIGDTWIYGVGSDPIKIARYRELARLRCDWIERKQFRVGDATDIRLLRRLLLLPEHTWGTDTKRWLDFDHYLPKDLAGMLNTKNYKVVEFSWEEKRQDLFDAVNTLPQELLSEAQQAIENLVAKKPKLPGGLPVSTSKTIETDHFVLRLDPHTGAIHRFYSKGSKREWATADHPMALVSYQTLSQLDYSRFFENYIVRKADWISKDFGKPNMEAFGVVSREWFPTLSSLLFREGADGHRLLASLEIRDTGSQSSGISAYPEKLYMEFYLPASAPVLHLTLTCLKKPATRLPEALWLTFNPAVHKSDGWTMDKSGEHISPFDVIPGGARQMHAVGTGFSYRDDAGTIAVETVDAPLIALGQRSPLNFSRTQPDIQRGIHCNLFNNAWGTNYRQWYGEDMRFRFVIRT